jgi:hypothetical protein
MAWQQQEVQKVPYKILENFHMMIHHILTYIHIIEIKGFKVHIAAQHAIPVETGLMARSKKFHKIVENFHIMICHIGTYLDI